LEQVQDRLKTHTPSDRKNAPTASSTSALDELGLVLLVFVRAFLSVLTLRCFQPCRVCCVSARPWARCYFWRMGDGRIVFADAKIEKLKEEEEAGKEAKREYKRQKKEEAKEKAKEVREIVELRLFRCASRCV